MRSRLEDFDITTENSNAYHLMKLQKDVSLLKLIVISFI